MYLLTALTWLVPLQTAATSAHVLWLWGWQISRGSYNTKQLYCCWSLLCTLYLLTRMPGESYSRRLRSLLLYLCYVFRVLINSLVCWFLLLYNAVFRSGADSLRSHVILHEWIAFYSVFLNIYPSSVLTARSVYTIQPCTMSLHTKPHT